MSTYEGWALLELMGHRVRAGYLKEVEVAGVKMLRIDIPAGQDDVGQDVTVSEFYAPGSVYSIWPCFEDIARNSARSYGADPRPVRPVNYREPRRVEHTVDDDDDEDAP